MRSMSDAIIATDNWARVAHRDAIKFYDEGGWNSQRRAMSLEKQGGFWNKTKSWGQAIAAWAQYATGTAVEKYGPKDLADWVSMPIDAVGAGIGVALPKNLHTYRKAGEELLNEVALPYVFGPSITRRVAASTAIDAHKYANWIADGVTTGTDALGDSRQLRAFSFSSIPIKRTPVLKMRSSDAIPNPRFASSSGSLRMRPSTGSLGRIATSQPASPNYARPSSMPRSLQTRPSDPTFSQTAIGLPAAADYSKLSTFARGLNVNPSSPTLSEMAKGLGSSRNYTGPTGTPVADRTSLPSGNPQGREANAKSLTFGYGSPSSIPTWDKLPRNVRDALRGAGFENWYRDPRNTEAGRLTLLNLYSKMQSKNLWRMVQGPAQPLSDKGPTTGSIQLRFKEFGGLRRNLFDRDDFTNPTWSPSSWSANWESRSKDSAAQLHLKNWSGDVVEAHIDPVGFVWRRPWSFIPHVQDMDGYTNVTKIGEILRSQGHASWAAGASSGGSVARGKMLAQPQGPVSRLTTGFAGGTARGIDASLSDAGVARTTQNLPTGPSHAKLSAMSQVLYSRNHSPAFSQTPKELGSSPNYPRPSNMARNLHAVPTSSTFSQTAIGLPTSPNYGSLSTFARGLYVSPSSPTLGQMAKGLGPSASYTRPNTMPGGLKTSSFSGGSNQEGGLTPLPPVYGNSISMSGGIHPGVSNKSLSKTAGAGLASSPLSGSAGSISSPSNALTPSGNRSSTGSSLNPNSSSGRLSSMPSLLGTPSSSNKSSTLSKASNSSFFGGSRGQGDGPGNFNPAAIKNLSRPFATSAGPQGGETAAQIAKTAAKNTSHK